MADPPIRPARVTPRRLSALAERLHDAALTGEPTRDGPGDTQVTGITHDSRSVQPGDLYIARAGEHTHGIEHLDAAVAAGAVAVLTDPEAAARVSRGLPAIVVDDPRAAMGAASAWAYGDPAADLLVLGVTGTNGKTTTAYLLEAGLSGAGRRTGLLGTIETRIAGEAIPSARTTPEATDLHALLAVMRERDVDSVAMEVSSHALALGRVDGIVFDVAGFTNLSQDHLDFHHDMDSYFEAKAALFTPAHAKRGVVTVDDDWGVRLAGSAGVPVVTVGETAGEWRRDDGTQETVLTGPAGDHARVRTELIGEFNLANAALAYLMLRTAGVEAADVSRGIAQLRAVPGRMERIDAGQPYLALVDYAHTPAAVSRLLAEARHHVAPPGRLLLVLGCGGDRDREKRPLMGAAAAAGADYAVFTNDNPRSEVPADILAAMLSGVPDGASIVVEPDRTAAIETVVGLARAGDVVVVAGKGHEQGQETAGVIVPFDDRTALREAIRAHEGSGR